MNRKMHYKPFCLEVKGDFACFTRPEMKVERVSYDVPTPSAVRAIFESIFWKPAIRWHVQKIEILNPIKWISIRRNEVGKIMSPRSEGLFIEEDRQQRAALLLRDVKYRFHATMEYLPIERRINNNYTPVAESLWDPSERQFMIEEIDSQGSHTDESPGKYLAIFERRAKRGQCFHQPYLGCREFSCNASWVEETAVLEKPILETRDLGFMLYDLDFTDASNPQPMFFHAKIEKGVVHIPPFDSKEVRR